MSLKASDSSNGSTFKPVPTGTHLARCYRIVDLGTQETVYMGQKKNQHKVMFSFEVHSEDDQGNKTVTEKGEPMSISKNYTMSLHEKSGLRKDLQSWRGKEFTAEELRGFDLEKVLGVWCTLNIIRTTGNDGKEYTNIAGISPVSPLQKKVGLPEGFNEPKLFSIENPDMALFDTFSTYLKEKIAKSPEWQARNEGYVSVKSGEFADSNDDGDDIPFN